MNVDAALNEDIFDDEKTLKRLKNTEITLKGSSKAFTIFLILWYLSKDNMHGYLIMKKIDEIFEPHIRAGLMKETKANKIYPILKELSNKNLIEYYPGIHKNKDVKIYRLTDEGQEILNLLKKSYKVMTEGKVWNELFEDLNS
ncbi:MAG: hypothetical protein BZ138_00305 [Methanosphaera sp. rholeuAM270]|nr:MAG: hypothetical protein BZ138_00305 [Methanosphaera sp. rholeuAM270]